MIYLFIVEYMNTEINYTIINTYKTLYSLMLNNIRFTQHKANIIEGLANRGFYTVGDNTIVNFNHNNIDINDTHPIMRSMLKSKREYDIKQLLSI